MNNTVIDLFNGLKAGIEIKINAPYTYYTQSKYTTYCKEQFKSIDDALNHAKEFLNNYFEGGILSCDLIDDDWGAYNKEGKKMHDYVAYDIKGMKYNHTLSFKLFILNNTEDFKNDLENLINSYNDFINFNDDKLNKEYNLKGFIPCNSWHTASYSFASSGLYFINKDTLEVKGVCYDWQDYEYSDPSMRDEHDYYIERLGVNKFASKLQEYAKLLEEQKNKNFCKGAIIEVIKGRKLPKGLTGVVKDTSFIHDCYKRCQGEYLHLTDGTRINKNNVILKGYVSTLELAKFV